MPSFKRPGVYAIENLSPNFVAGAPPGTLATFIGYHQQGPLVPTIVNSWSQFTSLFGGFSVINPTTGQPVQPTQLALSVFNYFSNGGTQCQIVRVVASGTGQATPQPALISQTTLSDQAATPQNTVTVQSQNPGAWGNLLYIDTVPHAPATGNSGTFDLIVHLGGSGVNFIVERWLGVSMDQTNPSYAPNVINNQFTGSNYVRVMDLGDATTPPSNEPAAVTGVQLLGGADGSVPTSLDIQSATAQLDAYPGPMLLNIPGDGNSSDIGNIIAYAQGRLNQDAFVIVDPPQGEAVGAVVTLAEGLAATSYAAMYYPWINIQDPVNTVKGSLRLCPPGGFVAAAYAVTDQTRGPWKAPAGLATSLATAVSLERNLTNADQDSVAVANVNAILAIPQSGICIMGAKTLSNILVTQFVPVRRSLIEIRVNAINKSRFALFEPNDSITWNAITNVLSQYLLAYWQSGGLAGTSPQEAFYVQCDSTNNTPSSIQQGVLNVAIGVAPQFPAQFIIITIGLWQGNQTVSSATLTNQ